MSALAILSNDKALGEWYADDVVEVGDDVSSGVEDKAAAGVSCFYGVALLDIEV